VTKEFCKSVQKATGNGYIAKIGGRWYLSGGKLKRPIVDYINMEFGGLDYDREVFTGFSTIRYWQKPLSEKTDTEG
jgi:hypothetical protein